MVVSKSRVFWTIKEVVDILRQRQVNEYDANFCVSGRRGDGKSTLICKIMLRMVGFRPLKHQVYSRNDVLSLLKNQQFGYCWDDEAVNSGYKREFQNKGQQELIKIVTAFRDNYNIYATAIPSFYSLDKDLREMVFMHIHIIERGLAVIFIPISEGIHSGDCWDTKNNARIEEKWREKKAKDPTFKFPYHTLSTFAGYLYFKDLSPKQKERYKKIKAMKRKIGFMTEQEKQKAKEDDFYSRMLKLILANPILPQEFDKMCFLQGRKSTRVRRILNERLKEQGKPTLSNYLKTQNQLKELEKEKKAQETREQFKEMIDIEDI